MHSSHPQRGFSAPATRRRCEPHSCDAPCGRGMPRRGPSGSTVTCSAGGRPGPARDAKLRGVQLVAIHSTADGGTRGGQDLRPRDPSHPGPSCGCVIMSSAAKGRTTRAQRLARRVARVDHAGGACTGPCRSGHWATSSSERSIGHASDDRHRWVGRRVVGHRPAALTLRGRSEVRIRLGAVGGEARGGRACSPC